MQWSFFLTICIVKAVAWIALVVEMKLLGEFIKGEYPTKLFGFKLGFLTWFKFYM